MISGGPMMGYALPSLDAPMAKGTSGLILFSEKKPGPLKNAIVSIVLIVLMCAL